MKKAVIFARKKAGVVETPMPKPVGHWALVKVCAAPMCTEYKAFLRGVPSRALGHEAAGEVVDVDQAHWVRPGERVVVMPQLACGRCTLCLQGDYIHCQNQESYERFTGGQEPTGTMSQYLLKPDWLLPKLPDDIRYDHGGMACCGLGPTFGALERMGVNVFDTILITGLGPVGLGGVINASYRGARVIGVDGNAYRRALATELGADFVFSPTDGDALERILDVTGGAGVDKAVDCSGAAQARRLCIDACRRLGHVAIVGEGGEFVVNGSDDLIRKGLTIHGCWHYNMRDVPRVFEVIRACGDKLDKMITHRFAIDDMQQAFELQATGQCGKVIIDPWA